MNKVYLKSLNWFRGLAIIFVFLTHVPKGNLNPEISTFLSSFFGNGTFFFVFISGYLFWHLKDRFEYVSYIEGKFKNVILPYLFVLVPVLILTKLVNFGLENSFTNPFIQDGIIWHILVGGMNLNAALWFIPMITLFFITSPCIYALVNSKYLNIILFISLFFSMLSFRPDSLQFPIYSYFHFFGVYLFGIFCKMNEKFIFDNSKNIAYISFVAYLFFILIDYNSIHLESERMFFYPMFTNGIDYKHINLNQLQKLFGTVFFLSAFFYMEKKHLKMEFKILDVCAKYSFGVFFVHFYWLLIINVIFKDKFIELQGFKYIYISILGFFASIVSVYLFKLLLSKFNRDSRLFIGC